MSNKLNIGFLGFFGKLSIKEGCLRFSSLNAKRFQVMVKDIQTVTVDTGGWGKSKLKIVGHGTVLAEVELITPYAEKCQRWILNEIGKLGK